MKKKHHYPSPIGTLCVETEGDFLVGLYMDDQVDNSEQETQLHQRAYRQLTEYFARQRTTFDLPLKVQGTPFQMKVWDALQQIPYGQTRSYADIAKMIDNPKACRAVGGANNKNPIMIIIPCHRVINANGTLGGFGCGTKVKEYLLALEQKSE